MGKSDKYMADHVRSAKVWLEKAERSFNSQSDIQGELNLMLAEAEMKNLRKKKRRTLGKRIAIVTAALGIILIGTSAFLAQRRPVDTALPPPAQTVRLAPPTAVTETAPPLPGKSSVPLAPLSMQAVTVTMPEAQTVPEPAPLPQAQPAPEAPHQTSTTEPAAPAADPVLSDQQVQAAVQDARHTLRSTATERK